MHKGNIMDNIDFTEDEIQEQLVLLGYRHIPKHRLSEFKKDLDELIRHGDLKDLRAQTSPSKPPKPPSASSPNPPAFTKEKVAPCSFDDCDERFFLHTGDVNYDKRVRPSCQNGDCRQPQGLRSDSYVRHSVASRIPPPPGFPQRLQLEAETSETLQTSNHADHTFDEALQLPLTGCCTPSTDSQTRPCITRKVLRKHKGQSVVCDESVYTENSDAASCLEERLEELRLSEARDQDQGVRSWSDSSETEDTFSDAFQTYARGLSRDGGLRPKAKSFIRPVLNQRTVKKSDPVARYFQYKQLWDMFQLPGQADRKALRLEIKERLSFQPPPPKPRRVYVPNTYVVPTEKKRSALRWEIRTCLARGGRPCKLTC